MALALYRKKKNKQRNWPVPLTKNPLPELSSRSVAALRRFNTSPTTAALFRRTRPSDSVFPPKHERDAPVRTEGGDGIWNTRTRRSKRCARVRAASPTAASPAMTGLDLPRLPAPAPDGISFQQTPRKRTWRDRSAAARQRRAVNSIFKSDPSAFRPAGRRSSIAHSRPRSALPPVFLLLQPITPRFKNPRAPASGRSLRFQSCRARRDVFFLFLPFSSCSRRGAKAGAHLDSRPTRRRPSGCSGRRRGRSRITYGGPPSSAKEPGRETGYSTARVVRVSSSASGRLPLLLCRTRADRELLLAQL